MVEGRPRAGGPVLRLASSFGPPLAFVLVFVLVQSSASAASASVTLTGSGTVWNGESRVDLVPQDAPRAVKVWVPANARLHEVLVRLAEGGFEASWSAAGPSTLSVVAPGDATAVIVRFDIPERRPYLARFVAPEGVDEATLRVVPGDGRVAESPDATFLQGAWSSPVRPGDAVSIQVVEPGRVGEMPLFLTVAGFALVVLVGTLVWHRVRPPLEGREPQKLLDHLAELQARLLPPVLLFALFNLFYFTSGLRMAGGWVVPTWGADASVSARAFEALSERLVPPDVQLVVLRPADAVLAQVGMCLFLSLATVLPLLVYEIAAFLGPGLAPKERGVALRVLPLVTGLFLAGALLGYLLMAPLMIRTLYDYAPGIGATPLLAVGDLVSFALLIVLALGAAFELPVVMFVLARLGLIHARTFARYLRHAVLAIVVIAGFITPDPSVISQLLLAVPIVVLYLLGIGAAAYGERAAAPRSA
ncbi:MAG TPA: twin-arginine translocase subunit TatC [Candidatus Thermoplasmatota archaeon]|nr:twin-arginine translocase subunit TatC [Candidatus Thermoplasmatota archaeon]